jgi:hypothetical protein
MGRDNVGPSVGTGKPRSAAAQNLRAAVPTLLALGAIAAVVLGTFMTVKTYRTDQQVKDLRHHGVLVTYEVATCTSGDNGLTCDGSFRFHGTVYTESISGILNEPNSGASLSAITDPKHPASYVYVRSAIYGPNAAGQGSWLLGAVLLGIVAIVMAVLSRTITSKRRNAALRGAAPLAST